MMDEEEYRAVQRLAIQCLHHYISLFVAILLTGTSSLLMSLFEREPYHTSILTGQGWMMELLNGHPEQICCELGVDHHVFLELIQELQQLGYNWSKYVSPEEQLTIFLYMSVTELTIRHVGECFQQSNETISQWIKISLQWKAIILMLHFSYFWHTLFIFSSYPFYTKYVQLPTADNPAMHKICENPKFWPYFTWCIGW